MQLETTETLPKPKVRLISIDALRGLSALIILLFHARSTMWVGLRDTWQQNKLKLDADVILAYLSTPLVFGGLAVVMLFFVLSGYCIHRRGAKLLAENPDVKIEWGDFIFRRIWRIYPTYLFALIFTGLIDWYLLHNQTFTIDSSRISQFQNNSLPILLVSLLSLQGIAGNYFGSNPVFWTLGIIFHFYLAYPILFGISKKYGALNALKFSFFISVAYLILDLLTKFTKLLPYSGPFDPIFLPYWFTWTAGFYIAEVEAGRASLPKYSKIILIVSTIVCIIAQLLEIGQLVIISAAFVFAGLIYWSITPKGNEFYNFWLGKFLARLGTFSYTIFAFHFPLLFLIFYSLSPSGKKMMAFYPVILTSGLIVGISYILFLLVERWTFNPPLANKKSK